MEEPIKRRFAGEAGPVVVGRGPIDTERRLLEAVRRFGAEVAREPSLLRRPVLIVVPSETLRQHVLASLARASGPPSASARASGLPSALGIAVRRLGHVAEDVLRRAGIEPPPGDMLFPLFARRAGALQPALGPLFQDFDDSWSSVAASIRDLLSAGFRPDDLPRFLSLIDPPRGAAASSGAAGAASSGAAGAASSGAASAASKTRQARAAAVLRAAAETASEMERAGLGRYSDRYRLAAEALRADRGRNSPGRAVLIHGFADAPGLATEFLRAILSCTDSAIFLDVPPDPARAGDAATPDASPSAAHVRRFARRLGLDLPPLSAGGTPAPLSAGGTPALLSAGGTPALLSSSVLPDLVVAAGIEGEVREAAVRIRGLLDGGVAPEEIGVVVRRLDDYAAPIRRLFTAFGIPFSGGRAPAGSSPAARRIRALLETLRLGRQTPCDLWIPLADAGARPDLPLGLRAAGIARLGELADLDIDALLDGKSGLPLPVRRAAATPAPATDEGGDGPEEESSDGDEAGDDRQRVAPRQFLPARILEHARDRARETVRGLDSWPRDGTLGVHFGHADRIARAVFGSEPSLEAAWNDVRAALGGGAAPPRGGAALPRGDAALLDLLWDRDGFLILLANLLERAGTSALGGAGAGVRILDAPRARGLTFRHGFVLGVNRGVYPRPVAEDPLLPDDVRAVLAESLLPHLALKTSGRDEERHLFDGLLAAAPHRTLSWLRTDEDGRELSPSPFVERLRLALPDPETWNPHLVPGAPEELFAPRDDAGRPRPRLAREAALHAALTGPRASLAPLLAAAIEEEAELAGAAGAAPPGPAAGVVAAARLRVIEEIDPDRRTPEGRKRRILPGPYLGLLGANPFAGQDLHVTTLEKAGHCPWSAFLGRALRLEAAPDPLLGPPDLHPILVGNATHDALDRIVRALLRPGTPDQRRITGLPDADVPPVPRPADPDVERHILEACRAAARDDGLLLPGLVQVLVHRVRELVAEALRLDWGAGGAGVSVVGVELEAAAEVRARLSPGSPALRVGFRADRADLITVTAPDGRPVRRLRFTDYKTGKPMTRNKTADAKRKEVRKAVQSGRHLQGAAYASALGGAALGRYLFLDAGKTDDDPNRKSVELSPGDEAVSRDFRVVVSVLLEAMRTGVFVPRLLDPRGRTPRECKSCEFRPACVQGDSAARHRLGGVAAAALATSLAAPPAGLAAGTGPGPDATLALLWHLEGAAPEWLDAAVLREGALREDVR